MALLIAAAGADAPLFCRGGGFGFHWIRQAAGVHLPWKLRGYGFVLLVMSMNSCMEEEVFLCRVLSPEGGRLSGCFSSWDYEQLAEDILLCRVLSTEAGQAFSAVGTMRKLRRKSFCVESCHLKGGRLFSLRRKSFCVESCHLQGGQAVEAVGL